jgi:uncharacterized protein involved in exopolysaccharide biosynthesis
VEETKEKYRTQEQGTLQEKNGPLHAHEGKPPNSSEVLDLSTLVQQLWAGRKIVLWTALSSVLISLFIAIISPVEYKSEVLLLPQSESSQAKGLGFLQQFGVSIGGGGGDMSSINTTLYPEVVSSTPYLSQLADQQIPVVSLDTSVSLVTYFNEIAEKPLIEDIKKYTIGLPKLVLNIPVSLIKSFQGEDLEQETVNNATGLETLTQPQSPSEAEDNNRIIAFDIYDIPPRKAAAIAQLKKRISVEIKANGIVSVSAKMPEPLAAAKLTSLSVNYLTDYIVQYRTEKVKQNLKFIEQQYEESEKTFVQVQQELASFRDRNQNMVTERARAELDRLQTQYDLHFGIYRSFAQQIEQAKIKLQEETPVFRELEPVKVPTNNSEPNVEIILIGSLFFGIFLGVGILLVKVFWRSFAQSINFKL